jgi:hypothetical protein
VTGIHAEPHTTAGRWRPAGWVVPLFTLAVVVLVPWIVFLVRSLPSTEAAAHWDIAWAGFDVGLALVLLAVAIAAWRRSSWLEGAATAAAALLAVDAWFDILTSSSRLELVVAIGEAVLVELPLAVLCLLLARDVERVLRGRAGSAGERVTGLEPARERNEQPHRRFDVVELHGLDGRVHVAQRHGNDAGRDADAA